MNNLALVNICSVGHKSSAVGAEFFESHSALERTDLTERTPASSPIAAALGLGDGVPVAGADLAHVLEDLCEAVSFPIVQALVLRGAGCEAIIALTGEAPHCVETAPVLADPRLGLAFILIDAAFPIWRALIARPTDAHVQANEILALHLLLSAIMFARFTLILIFAHPPVFSENVSGRTFAFI